jgi:aspartyl/asparaginyl beta-hydroxylase (cupin superfamily)
MLTALFTFTGLVVWALLILMVAGQVLTRGPVRRWLEASARFPYWQWTRCRLAGGLMTLLRRLGVGRARRVAPEVVTAFRTARLGEFKDLRAVMHELDALPTVQRGLAAIGLKSIFEVPTADVHLRKSPYTDRLQRPYYYVPGVPARTFHDPAGFDWVKPLEDAYPEIKEELLGVLHRSAAGFKAYMNETQERMQGWNTFNFFFQGRRFEENCRACPRTADLLESLPRFERDHIMFSALNPHAHIPPHTGPMNGIVRGHLALVAPPGSFIKVGADERTWEEGKVLVFDDSYVHEVWNHSDHVRIVLFMNFWHPCFAEEEIEVLTRFRAAYSQSPLGRVHEDNQAAQRAHDLALQAMAAAKAAAAPAAEAALAGTR